MRARSIARTSVRAGLAHLLKMAKKSQNCLPGFLDSWGGKGK